MRALFTESDHECNQAVSPTSTPRSARRRMILEPDCPCAVLICTRALGWPQAAGPGFLAGSGSALPNLQLVTGVFFHLPHDSPGNLLQPRGRMLPSFKRQLSGSRSSQGLPSWEHVAIL